MKPRLKLLTALAVGAICVLAAYRAGRRTAYLPAPRPAAVTLPSEALAHTGFSLPVKSGQLFGALAFNRDASLLAIQTETGIAVLNYRTGATLFSADRNSGVREEMQEKQAVFSFLHSKDSLLFCQSGGRLTLRDIAGTGKAAEFPLESGGLRAMTVKPDDSEALLSEDNGLLTLLSLKDGSMKTLPGPSQMSVAAAAAYSPDGLRIASAWSDGVIQIHDSTGGTRLSSSAWHHGEITKLEFTPDGGRLAVSSDEGKVCLLDVASGTELRTEEKAFLLNGRFALVQKEDGKTEILDFVANASASAPASGTTLLSAAISPDGSTLATQSAAVVRIEHLQPSAKPFIFPAYAGGSPAEEREYFLRKERARAARESAVAYAEAGFDFSFPAAAVEYNPATAAFEFNVLGKQLEADATFSQAADFARLSREPILYGKLRPDGNGAYELLNPVLKDKSGGPALAVRPAMTEPMPEMPPAPLIPGRKQRAYETASKLYAAGQKDKALELLGALAREKYAPAMTALAALYSRKVVPGMGDREAMELELSAAGYGETRALIRMGERMLYGIGVSSDSARAMDYFTEAAQGGSPEAAYWLGSALALQEGAPIDQAAAASAPLTPNMLLAAKWLRKSAEAGYARGQLAYGEILENGIGTAMDQESALDWYTKAAGQGLSEALIRQARLTEARARTPGEKAQALRLLVRAAGADRSREGDLRGFLSRQTPEELRAILAVPKHKRLSEPGKLSEDLLAPPEKPFSAPPMPPGTVISRGGAASSLAAVALLLAAAAIFAALKLPSCPRNLERRCAVSVLRLMKKAGEAAGKAAAAVVSQEAAQAGASTETASGKSGNGDTKKDKPDDKDDTVLKISL